MHMQGLYKRLGLQSNLEEKTTSSYPTQAIPPIRTFHPHLKTQAIRTIYPHMDDAQVIRISIPLKLSALPIRT